MPDLGDARATLHLLHETDAPLTEDSKTKREKRESLKTLRKQVAQFNCGGFAPTPQGLVPRSTKECIELSDTDAERGGHRPELGIVRRRSGEPGEARVSG